MNYLSFHSRVFYSFSYSFLRNVFNIPVLVNLRNVFSLVLDCVIVSNLFFFRYVFDSLHCFVFDYGFIIRYIFDS